MKKVLIFIDNLGSGGAQRRAINIANLLKENRYDVTLLTYHQGVFYNSECLGLKIECLEQRNKGKRLIILLKYLVNCNYDVVVSFMDSPNFIACIAKILGGRWKLITTESSAQKSSFEGKRYLMNYLERVIDYKVCNSHNSMNMWMKNYPFIRGKIGVIYNPVIIKEDKSQIIDTYKTSNFPLKITIAASYQYLKNPIGLIKAVAKLSESNTKKIIIEWYGRIEPTEGDRKAYDEAMSLVEKYHLEECIHLNCETKDIYRLIKESDAVGLFSMVEGLPNAICEGMMLKKPVVMTRVSDYNMLVNGNGYLCDASDENSIANALEQMINSSPELIRKMGEKSYTIAQELFSPDVVIRQWIHIIEGEQL